MSILDGWSETERRSMSGGVAEAESARKTPKSVIRRFSEEVVNKGNFDVLAELVHEDVKFNSTVAGAAPGIDGVREIFSALHKGFSNAACAIEELVAEGETVAERFTFTGTHSGEFHGVRATGKRVSMSGMAMFRVVDGKIAARWGLEDQLGLLRQLGALRLG
ncbi:ester cyclase [Streptomyces sp. NBC_00322]|uniref:ester cyclase n=1 Tax=Streptomyces sp. NBC_00322 TaxID=2975712 RepID=UPI002E2CBBED|nr:ester cyclase [Streptomyces sp. NBC_00322]